MASQNKNLIAESTFPEDWEVVNLTKKKAKWAFESGGIITQTKEVGTAKRGAGTLLVHKTPLKESTNKVALDIQIGSIYQVGAVFNYLDKENFCVFVIDRKRKKYHGFEAVVAEIREGSFQTICREKFKTTPKIVSTFEVSKSPGGILLNLNGNEIYTWPDRPLEPNGRIGLYCQKNFDAKYLNLFTEEAVAAEQVSVSANDMNQNNEASLTEEEIPASANGTNAQTGTVGSTQTQEANITTASGTGTLTETAEPALNTVTTSDGSASTQNQIQNIPPEEIALSGGVPVTQSGAAVSTTETGATSVNETGAQTKNITIPDQSKFGRFLKMSSPRAKTIIETKESFRVALDSFYTHLFDRTNSIDLPINGGGTALADNTASGITTLTETVDSTSDVGASTASDAIKQDEITPVTRKTSRMVALLDYRPRRWYREYQRILDAKQRADWDVIRAKAILDDLEKEGIPLSEFSGRNSDLEKTVFSKTIKGIPPSEFSGRDNFEKLRSAIRTARKVYYAEQSYLKDEQKRLEAEMRAAGYMIQMKEEGENTVYPILVLVIVYRM